MKNETVARIQKHSALSPQQFSKATEMTSQVLKSNPPVNNVEIKLIYHQNHENTLKNLCSFN